MKNNSNNQELESRLQEINSKLEKLDLYYRTESTKLKDEIETLQSAIANSASASTPAVTETEVIEEHLLRRVVQDPEQELEVGDVVKIENNYKGLKGTVGVVKTIKNKWVWLVDHRPKSKPIQHNIENVTIVPRPYNYGFYQDEWGQWVYTGKGKAAKGGKVKTF